MAQWQRGRLEPWEPGAGHQRPQQRVPGAAMSPRAGRARQSSSGRGAQQGLCSPAVPLGATAGCGTLGGRDTGRRAGVQRRGVQSSHRAAAWAGRGLRSPAPGPRGGKRGPQQGPAAVAEQDGRGTFSSGSSLASTPPGAPAQTPSAVSDPELVIFLKRLAAHTPMKFFCRGGKRGGVRPTARAAAPEAEPDPAPGAGEEPGWVAGTPWGLSCP